MATTVNELVQDAGKLVTLPDVFLRINQLVEDPDSTLADIAAAVSRDPAFTLRLLRVANSSYYGFSTRVDNVARAVTMIGTGQVRSLALATSVASSFEGLPNALVSLENFWKHSLYCALIARKLAKRIRHCDPEAVFTAGLLHDIGELVIFNRMPAEAGEALTRVRESADEPPVYQSEREVMGFDHAQVGGELARKWNLPGLLVESIACHHDIESARDFKREVALVHIANSLAQMAEIHSLEPTDVTLIEPQAWEIVELAPEDVIEETVTEAQGEFAEAASLFLDK